jgi:chromosome segregation ATPase
MPPALLCLALVAAMVPGAMHRADAVDPTTLATTARQRSPGPRTVAVFLSQCVAAENRARWAQALGQREPAIAELRTVTRLYRAEVQRIWDQRSRYCDPIERLDSARAESARASAWLAELEGNPEELVSELTTLLAYQEKSIQRMERLEARAAATPDDTKNAREAFHDLELRLNTAKQRLESAREK